ncbi:MAG: hypothetical protein Q8M58_06825 [Anaerolineales bacterium]|nr:hypothetical protein [Anaerolineales bacterium]MDP3184965.1 hypothetical protein [Anaerolineales bacterium]
MLRWKEEINYRSSLLAPLHGVVGRQQALGLGACPACRTPIGASAAGRPSAGTGERRRRVRSAI